MPVFTHSSYQTKPMACPNVCSMPSWPSSAATGSPATAFPRTRALRKHPELADEPACAAELIYHEFSLRQELGESPDWQQQLGQYPEHAALLERLRQADQLVEQTLAAPEQLPAGAFADYELLEEVGRGGMGVVFKARHQSLDRIVALKVLRSDGTGEERERFDREARAVARLQHPNIVQIYEVGEAAGQAFVSLEFVDGQSLARRLHGTPLPARQTAALVEILARAMHYAHEKGVIHRDLKPSNIMMRLADGTARAGDRRFRPGAVHRARQCTAHRERAEHRYLAIHDSRAALRRAAMLWAPAATSTLWA